MRLGRQRLIWAAATAAAAAGAGVLAQRRHIRQIADDPEDRLLRNPPAGRPLTITAPDGTKLHAEEFGAPDGETFVLAHGWTEALTYWIYVIRELTGRGFRVVAYDLRGHGHSEPAVGGDYSLERFGEDLEAVVTASVPDGKRAIVAGHSLGAMSIAAWAEHHDVERRASAAALLNTGIGELLAEQLLIPVPALANVLNRIVPPQLFLTSRAPTLKFSTPLSAAVVRYIAFGPSASPAKIAFYEQMLITTPPDVRADVGLALSEMDLRHTVPRLTVPTLVLAGENDRLTPPSHARRIAAELPRLHRLVILPETGHMGPLERPREVTDALLELAAAATGSKPDKAIGEVPVA
jgi:pimeloyl-ACP methyl ester carboxylesterase